PVLDRFDSLAKMDVSSTKLINYFFKNNGDLTFTDASSDNGITDPSFSNGASYADLDLDGDLDLVISNLHDPVFIYRNNADMVTGNNSLRIDLKGSDQNLFGIGAKVIIEYSDQKQFQELTLTRGFQSSVERMIHFGLGDVAVIDKLTITWPNGKVQELRDIEANKILELSIADASPAIDQEQDFEKLFKEVGEELGIDYVHKENPYNDFEKEILLPHKMSQFGPNLAVGDVNG
ncbi:MAG: ASPIC/UnbV domain-containing protein, partial [Bacteroidetes bacterium]|nr:ASPIC/UnbV domain-containing protein [Bacteroidota bacterium]